MSEQSDNDEYPATLAEMYGKPTTAEARAQHRIGYGPQGAIYESDEHWEEQLKVWNDRAADQSNGDL